MRLASACLALIGLASAAWPLTPLLYPEITLIGGEAQTLADTDVTLRLDRVDDGRCPAGADCLWEGTIRVEISVITAAPEQQQIVLCNLCDDASSLATAGGMTFGLVALSPSTDDLAQLGRPPELGDYRLTLNYAPALP